MLLNSVCLLHLTIPIQNILMYYQILVISDIIV